eukprot:CAMPEP_0198295244 /NCGR_PEP_ID=MMETSP1449-20131203/26694_1 /TAXON_ID=420275 /ORGANISM="Attheya septentrionalis, Strain CCMP2084" /LENGTH=358 /DNA_ID=CAMNT_0043995485 /DNA_START=446 /DNA_END=1522 /DNA_ORIENTATION=-
MMLFPTIQKRSFSLLVAVFVSLANVCTNVVSAYDQTTTQQDIGKLNIYQCSNAPILVTKLQTFCTNTDNETGITARSTTCNTGDNATILVEIYIKQDLGENSRRLQWYKFWENSNNTLERINGTLSNVTNATEYYNITTNTNNTTAAEYLTEDYEVTTNTNTAAGYFDMTMSLKTTNSNNRRLEKTATVSFFQNALCCACFVPDNSANTCPSAGSFTLEKYFSFPSFDDDLEQVIVTEDLDFVLSIKKNEGDSNPSMNYAITGNQVNQDQCPSNTNSYPFVSYMDDAPRVADTNTIFSNLSSATAATAIAATAFVAVACVAGFFLWKTMDLTGGKREIKLNDDETHTSGNFINNDGGV